MKYFIETDTKGEIFLTKNSAGSGKGSVSTIPKEIPDFLEQFTDKELSGEGDIQTKVPKSFIRLMKKILID